MGVFVTQQPTSINVTGTDLIYTVSSSIANSAQFRFVTDIYQSGSNNFITRLKTYPNLYGAANINISRELGDQEGYDNTWTITQAEACPEVKDYIMYFGEEYASSLSSSREVVTGSIGYDLQVFPGGVEVNEGRNFPSASFNPTPAGIPAGENPRLGSLLSNSPAQQVTYLAPTFDPSALFQPNDIALPIGVQDYATLSVLKNPGWGGLNISIPLQIEVWDSTGQISVNSNINIDPALYATNASGVIDIPSGPFNFVNNPAINAAFQGDWSAYVIRWVTNSPPETILHQWYINPLNPGIINAQASSVSSFWKDQIGSMLPQNPCQDYTRFAWTNQYGMWDYYNVYNPVRRNTAVKRNIYSRPNTRYEDCYAGYDVTNRGERQYMTQYTDTFSITTDYIDKYTSQWLTEMFFSNDVYIQNGNQFEPIIISNRSIDWNMNQYRQKLFQYEIEYKLANQRETR
tara:strand:+ start:5162 stop:6541 length:1380 start_codon:yes stop_codon:yes gene_type:complete